ncbi:hypothetical protein JCM17380_43370 [Desulfosporosinus burensis]
MFRNKILGAFELRTAKIVDIMPTVLPVVEAKEKRVDFVFLLEDDTLLHLEFQTTVAKDFECSGRKSTPKLVFGYFPDIVNL